MLIGVAYGDDYAEGGYVRSSDSSFVLDEGISGMKQWLDEPVPSGPGYNSHSSFNNQAYSTPIRSTFKEYRKTNGATVGRGIISNPAEFDITQETPSSVYYGAGHELPYSKYVSILPFETNDLWIRGAANWTRYFAAPVGTKLHLIANVSRGGPAAFYEVIQTDTTISKNNIYQFYEGYNSMDFIPDQTGRYMLYFVADNQSSNLVIVDVTGQAPAHQRQTYPGTIETPISFTTPQTFAAVGDTPARIQSQGMKGYQVYVDDVHIGTEGTGGDALDGVFNFKVVGGQNHAIRVDDGQFNYVKNIYFVKNVLKIINVEPGTEGYI